MKPLLKWPGGKSEELSAIAPLIPDHDRYVEPFVGGGAVYFHLEPESALINDVNRSLTSFYQQLGKQHPTDQGLPVVLRDLADVWTRWGVIADRHAVRIAPSLTSTSDEDLSSAGASVARTVTADLSDTGWVIGDTSAFCQVVGHRLTDKIKRIRRNEQTTGQPWTPEDVMGQTATAIRSALYYWVRDHITPDNEAERATVFFFLREFAYGGMFRFNANGKFNVPYGSRSYDRKDFGAKVEQALSNPVQQLLARTDIRCGSAADILDEVTERDFVFLDPPYDSPFSSYDQHQFTQDDHREIAELLRVTPAKFLLVIGATPFIEELYRDVQRSSSSQIVIDEYEKTYAYTIKGRNDRSARHLAIRNYAI